MFFSGSFIGKSLVRGKPPGGQRRETSRALYSLPVRSRHAAYLLISLVLYVHGALIARFEKKPPVIALLFIVLCWTYFFAGAAAWVRQRRKGASPGDSIGWRTIFRPPLILLFIAVAVCVVWIVAGGVISSMLFRYEWHRWNRSFSASRMPQKNAAAQRLEQTAKRCGIDFHNAKGTKLAAGIHESIDAITAADTDAPIALAPGVEALALDPVVAEVATIAVERPAWNVQTQASAIAGCLNVVRILLATAIAQHQRGDDVAALRSILAARSIRASLDESHDTVGVLVGSRAAEHEAAVVRRLSVGAEGLSDIRPIVIRYYGDEVRRLVELTRDSSGLVQEFPFWSRPFIGPYVSFSRAQYVGAWHDRLDDPGRTCRDEPAPAFGRWNYFARIASPEPQSAERIDRAMLAKELTAIVHDVRGSARSEPLVKSRVCSDVVWRISNRQDGFSVAIDREFVMRTPTKKVALSYSERRK